MLLETPPIINTKKPEKPYQDESMTVLVVPIRHKREQVEKKKQKTKNTGNP